MADGWPGGTRLRSTGAIERFEDRVQRQYSGELQQHVHALQDQCREHVGHEESKLRKELTNALTHESQVCRDSEVLSHEEVAQLRGLVAAQQEELRSIHGDCAELQRRSALTEAELHRRSTHEEHALYQRFDDAIKEKGRPGPCLAARTFAYARETTNSTGGRMF